MLHSYNLKVPKGRSLTVQKDKEKFRFQVSKVAKFKKVKVMFWKGMWGPFLLKRRSYYAYKSPKSSKHVLFTSLPPLFIELSPPLVKNTSFLSKFGKTLTALHFCELHCTSGGGVAFLWTSLRFGTVFLLTTLHLWQSNPKTTKTHPNFKFELAFLLFVLLSWFTSIII